MKAMGKCLANKEHPRYPEQYSIDHHCKAHEYPVNKKVYVFGKSTTEISWIGDPNTPPFQRITNE
jgi:hypothetical protein